MDWSGLPPELLHLISLNIAALPDLIRFRGVCKAWRAAASVSHLPPQVPCFLLARADPGSSILQFHSLTSGDTHGVAVPRCRGRTVAGSSNGYLLLHGLGKHELSLLNPVTDREISLPLLKVKRPELIWSSPDIASTVTNTGTGTGTGGSDNSGDDYDYGYAVSICGNPPRLSAFWRPGDSVWDTIRNGYQRSCYYKGLYLTHLPVSRVVASYDVAGDTIPDAIPPPDGEGPFNPPGALVFLVASASRILRVRESDDKYLPVDKCQFVIHRLMFDSEKKEQPHWIEIKSIGDQVLFLNVSNGFSVSAGCLPGFRGNSIYFLKEVDTGASYGSTYVLSWYDIETGTAEMLDFPCVTDGTWFMRSLR